MVYEEMGADLGPGVDVDARPLVGELGYHPGKEGDPELVEHVGEALEGNRKDAGVGEDDLLVAERRRVALVGRVDVRPDGPAHVGQLPERLARERAGPGAGVGVMREAQALLDLDLEPCADARQEIVHHRRHVLLREPRLLEISREEEVHALPGDLVHRLLGGKVDAVQMVDPAVRFVGGDERRLDCVEFHGEMTARKLPQGSRWVKTQFQGWTTRVGWH